MNKEKVYYELKEKNVKITSSRIMFPGQNYILRNVSSVKYIKSVINPYTIAGYTMISLGYFILFLGLGFYEGYGFNIISIPFTIGGSISVIVGYIIKSKIKKNNNYTIQIESGGKWLSPVKALYTNKEEANKIVEMINQAIYDLDNKDVSKDNSTSQKNNNYIDEIKQLKELLDNKIITQDEFDNKKNKLLNQ